MSQTWRSRHVVSFGGNVRYNSFDLSLAPRGDSRTEAGVYGQDEISSTEHFRAVVGARVDKFSSISGAVFSPRVTFMYKPTPSQTVRASFNRAYRAPSHVNNYLDVTLANALDLGALSPAAGRPPVHLPGRRHRQRGPEGREDDGLRDRLHGHPRATAPPSAPPSTSTTSTTRSSSRRAAPTGRQPAAGLAASAGSPSS